jgi:hypothetical protein
MYRPLRRQTTHRKSAIGGLSDELIGTAIITAGASDTPQPQNAGEVIDWEP